MNNATMRINITQSAIEILKQTFLSVMHQFKEQGKTEFIPADIAKELDITPDDGYWVANGIVRMLVAENKVEHIKPRKKYKLKG